MHTNLYHLCMYIKHKHYIWMGSSRTIERVIRLMFIIYTFCKMVCIHELYRWAKENFYTERDLHINHTNAYTDDTTSMLFLFENYQDFMKSF